MSARTLAARANARFIRTAGLASAFALAWISCPRTAAAQDASAIAEQLFRNGRALMESGKIAEGCEQLASSERVAPAIGTRLNLAICREKEGKTATAWSLFTDLEAEAVRIGDSARAQLAHEHGATLVAQLSKIIIDLTPVPPGTTVTMDGVDLPAVVIGTALPVDPGEHLLVVAAPGKRTWSDSHVHTGAPATTVHVSVRLEDGSSLGGEPAVQPAAASESTRTQRTLIGYAIVGAGVVALGVATYYGVTALNRKGDEANYPAGSQDRLTVYDQAKTAQTVELVTGGVGLVALGAGVALVLTDRSARASAQQARVRLVPLLGPTAGGISALGSF